MKKARMDWTLFAALVACAVSVVALWCSWCAWRVADSVRCELDEMPQVEVTGGGVEVR